MTQPSTRSSQVGPRRKGSAEPRPRCPDAPSSLRPLAAIVLACLCACGFGTSAAAAAPEADFYTPPALSSTGRPGDLLRTQPFPAALEPVLRTPLPVDAQRIMYRSTDIHGQPIAVSGAILVPRGASASPRPLVGLAPGTQGGADRCAPSRELETGSFYDIIAAGELLRRGWAVVVTDYVGSGTPGAHTYLDRLDEGRALLDAVRAARSELGPGPIGLGGYSQGGQAAASAAELQPGYAPELSIAGVYAGAVPADPAFAAGDDTSFGAETGYLLASLVRDYPNLDEPVRRMLNPAGQAMVAAAGDECELESLSAYPGSTAGYTVDGRTIAAHLAEEPFISVLARQRLGTLRPSAPVLVVQSAGDDSIPAEPVQRMVREWCGLGAAVRYSELPLPSIAAGTGLGHALGSAPAAGTGADFLAQRFAGAAGGPYCGS